MYRLNVISLLNRYDTKVLIEKLINNDEAIRNDSRKYGKLCIEYHSAQPILLIFDQRISYFYNCCLGHRLLIKKKYFRILITAISREDGEDSNHHNHHRGHGNNHNSKVPFNGYNSEEYLDRLEPNGNIPVNKSDLGYSKRKYSHL